MGDYADYCNASYVEYLAQVDYDQTSFKTGGTAQWNSFIAGTLIPAAEKFIDTFCNHSFGTPSLGTWRIDGNGKSFLPMPPERQPLIGIGAGSVSGIALSVADIKVSNSFIQLDGGNFSTGKKNVVLYGSYGYLDKDGVSIVPSDVSFVCAQLCANVINDMVRRRKLPDTYMSLMASPEASDVKFRGLFNVPHIFPSQLQEVLENYRIRWEDSG